jgi:hypothetical protein
MKPLQWFWGSNHWTIAVGFEAQTRKPSTTGFEAKPGETDAIGFEDKPEKNHPSGFEAKPLTNRPSDFEAKPLTNRRPWFWGSTKTPALLVSMCTVQTTPDVTQPPDRPTIEYLTCATIPGPLHQVSYSCHDPCCCPSCCTYHLHTTRQANTILQMKQR